MNATKLKEQAARARAKVLGGRMIRRGETIHFVTRETHLTFDAWHDAIHYLSKTESLPQGVHKIGPQPGL